MKKAIWFAICFVVGLLISHAITGCGSAEPTTESNAKPCQVASVPDAGFCYIPSPPPVTSCARLVVACTLPELVPPYGCCERIGDLWCCDSHLVGPDGRPLDGGRE